MKEKDIPLIYVTSISTVLIGFNFFTIYSFLVYRSFFRDIIPGKYYVLVPVGIIWILNYFAFVKRKRFLEYNFKKDLRGGMLIILYIFITAVLLVIVADKNRKKIADQKRQHPTTRQQKPKPSLEGRIKKWWRE
ncbi:hypothetical protein HQN84_20755 [Pedobacter steynii]|nr:hypothetical protein [Pedobacter steynii]NQX41293.1 hypothetical protein [Pedobacter steynii]